jgi:hypothetical protein
MYIFICVGLRWAGGRAGRVDRVRQARGQVGRVGRADNQVRQGTARDKSPSPEVEEGVAATEGSAPSQQKQR